MAANKNLVVLKAFMEDKEYIAKYFHVLNEEMFSPLQWKVIKAILKYFKEDENEGKTAITSANLHVYYRLNYTKDNQKAVNELFNELSEVIVPEEDLFKQFLNTLLEEFYASQIAVHISSILEGTECNTLDGVYEILDKYSSSLLEAKEQRDKNFINTDLNDILANVVNSEGLQWKLSCLREGLGPVRNDTLGHVFARVNIGKTTFLASEATHMAKQLKDDEVILWCNNEEQGKKVRLRTYCAMLGKDTAWISANPTLAEQEYERLGGNRIKIYDKAGMTTAELEKLIQELNVRLVIIDQGDKVHLSGKVTGDSEHLRLRALYDAYRELCKKYGIAMLTVGQASADATNKKWLLDIHMDNSKVGKPGALDYAIGIGALESSTEDSADYLRYIHLCKNKMHNGQAIKATVKLNPMIAQYSDLVDSYTPKGTGTPTNNTSSLPRLL